MLGRKQQSVRQICGWHSSPRHVYHIIRGSCDLGGGVGGIAIRRSLSCCLSARACRFRQPADIRGALAACPFSPASRLRMLMTVFCSPQLRIGTSCGISRHPVWEGDSVRRPMQAPAATFERALHAMPAAPTRQLPPPFSIETSTRCTGPSVARTTLLRPRSLASYKARSARLMRAWASSS